MSSTAMSVGLDETGRNSSNVMKPPGGDCHDLFGADFHGTPSHHRVLKPPGGGTSDIFTTSVDDTDKRISQTNGNQENMTANGIEKHGNESEKTSNTNLTNHDSGDGNLEDNGERKKQDVKPEAKRRVNEKKLWTERALIPASSMARNCVTGEGCQTQEHYAIRVVPQREGNPVTGEGYDDPKTQQSVPAPSRTRIPPGGYSSGLW